MKLLKTWLISLLILALLIPTAQAGDSLPRDVAKFFTTEKRSGYTIMSHCQVEDYYFVAAQNRSGVNHLFGFRKDGSSWEYWLRTDTAVPQGEWLTIRSAQGSSRLCDEAAYQLPALSIGRLEPNYHEYVDMAVTYVLRDGIWTLEDYSIGAMRGYCVTFDPGLVAYYRDSVYHVGTVRATVQRSLRYVDLSAIPTDYYEAKAKLTKAPTLPASAELQAQNIKFTGGRKYDVFSAPTRASYRGANGKAAVSTNSWIQVFGVEDGWAMIQYSIDAKHYRIGYIVEEALPANADVDWLNFQPIPAWTTRGVNLTDDPFYSGSSMTRLTNAVEVQWLATIGEWAYIEVTDGQLMRGFIPADALNTHMEFLPMVTPEPIK